jgi:6-pyruvoyl-tetrahydropterin synthase
MVTFVNKNVSVPELIVDVCDHRLLNDIPALQGVVTAMESMAAEFWDWLEQPMADAGMELCTLVLGETDDNFVTLRKE